jgi:hypothetical protein
MGIYYNHIIPYAYMEIAKLKQSNIVKKGKNGEDEERVIHRVKVTKVHYMHVW